jgi:hypothetical protein
MTRLDQLVEIHTSSQKQLTEIKEQLTSVDTKVISIDDKLSNVSSDLVTVNKNINLLENKVDLLECKNRENNVIFFGVSEAVNSKHEDIYDIIINLCSDVLKSTITLNEINKCYRIGAFKLNRKRPVLLSLVHNRIKTQIFSNAKFLKGSGVSISEDLTPIARDQKKLIYDSYVQAQNSDLKNIKRGKNHLIIDGVKIESIELQKPDWVLKFVKTTTATTSLVNTTTTSLVNTTTPIINTTTLIKPTPVVNVTPLNNTQGNSSTPPTPSRVGGVVTRLASLGNR